jgi:hypothetical protein
MNRHHREKQRLASLAGASPRATELPIDRTILPLLHATVNRQFEGGEL